MKKLYLLLTIFALFNNAIYCAERKSQVESMDLSDESNQPASINVPKLDQVIDKQLELSIQKINSSKNIDEAIFNFDRKMKMRCGFQLAIRYRLMFLVRTRIDIFLQIDREQSYPKQKESRLISAEVFLKKINALLNERCITETKCFNNSQFLNDAIILAHTYKDSELLDLLLKCNAKLTGQVYKPVFKEATAKKSAHNLLEQGINGFDIKMVEEAISQNANPNNLCNGYRETYFLNAVNKRCFLLREMHNALSKAKFDVDQNENWHLLLANSKNSLEIIKALIKARANINVKNSNNQFAVQICALNGDNELLELLLNSGAKLQFDDKPLITWSGHWSPIISAVEGGHLQTLNTLIAAYKRSAGSSFHVCLNFKCKSGKSPLHYAADRANANILSILLKEGIDPNIVDDAGNTALHYIVNAFSTRGDKIEAINILLRKDAERNMSNRDGITPYQLALDTDQREIAKLLVI